MSKSLTAIGVSVCVALLWWGYTYESSTERPAKEVPAVPSKENGQSELSSPTIPRMDDKTEAAARQKASDVLSKVLDVRRRIRDKSTADDQARHARYRVDRYRSLFRSWNIDEATVQESLQLLAERDKKLDELDDKMLDGKISPYAAAAEKKKFKANFEIDFSSLVGPELTFRFAEWDKTSNQRTVKKPTEE